MRRPGAAARRGAPRGSPRPRSCLRSRPACRRLPSRRARVTRQAMRSRRHAAVPVSPAWLREAQGKAGRNLRRRGPCSSRARCHQPRAVLAQELAWASYALLRNTNASNVLLVRGGRAWLARGAVGAAAVGSDNAAAALDALGQVRAQPTSGQAKQFSTV